MNRDRNTSSGILPDGSPPSESWLFAQAILGNPIPRIVSPESAARAKREKLARLAEFSEAHAQELRQLEAAEAEARRKRASLEWAAQISTRAAEKLRALQSQEAAQREAWRRAEQNAEQLREAWDPSEHPRAPQVQPDGGQWVGKGSASSAAMPSTPFRTVAFQTGSGTPSATWPTTGPASSWLPKVGVGAGAGAGAAAGISAGAFLGALRNGSMGAYWARVPGIQAMPQIWVWELERRVRAGTLSRQDAIEIFKTAVLGAEDQNFAPTGGTMTAVHNSAVDFLKQAEAIYFARKKKKQKEQGWATQRGGYQLSGGRVFPTAHNSGLKGFALRHEQEKFFERELAQGTDPDVLRGQASVAGEDRVGDPDRLSDPELEAALQRAIEKAKKRK